MQIEGGEFANKVVGCAPNLNMRAMGHCDIPEKQSTPNSALLRRFHSLSAGRKLDRPHFLLEVEVVQDGTSPSIHQKCSPV